MNYFGILLLFLLKIIITVTCPDLIVLYIFCCILNGVKLKFCEKDYYVHILLDVLK